MFTKLREPFGKAGLIVAICALVLALGGGAWALSASGGANHQGRYAKAKHHNHVVRGPQGPAGPEGPEGPAGVNGRNGTNGRNGVDGTDGLPGRSVVSAVEPNGENCEQGGYWFELQGSGSKQYVCNGSGGGGGGTVGGTELAPGDTEAGVWAIHQSGLTGSYLEPITYPLSVKTLPGQPPVTPVTADGFPEYCKGTADNPTAERGYACLYTLRKDENTLVGSGAYLTENSVQYGFVIQLKPIELNNPNEPDNPVFAIGTWAVTQRCPLNTETGEEELEC